MTRSRRLPPGMLTRLILSALLGVAFGAAAWFLGMDAPHAVGLGATVAAFVACLSALGEATDLTWTLPTPEPRPGARRDIPQLGWSLGSRGGRVSPEGMRRLRLVAERALAVHGLDLRDRAADPELERLLGRDVLAALRSGSTAQPPRTAFVALVLQRLEALERTDAAGLRGRTDLRNAPPASATPNPVHPASEETPRAR